MDYRPWTIAVLLLLTAATAPGQDRERTEVLSRRASARLQALQREGDDLASQERSLLTDLRRLEIQRDIKTEELAQLRTTSDRVARELGTIGNQIDALESEDSALRPLLAARMVELYKLGNAGYVRLLLNVSDLKEMGRAYRMVSAMAELDHQRAAAHEQNLAEMKKARAALEQRTVEMAKLQEEAAAARVAADRAATARGELIAQIDARRDLTAQLASELQAAQQRLQQTLGAIGAAAPSTRADAPSLPMRPFRGDLDWPITGRVVQRFSRAASNRPGTASMQDGIQIAAQENGPVHAVHEGTVAFAGPFTGYGNLVILDHGVNIYTLYGELDSVDVTRGARVDQGQSVGTAGHILIGLSGIYFEIRVDGKPADPLEWLKRRQPTQ